MEKFEADLGPETFRDDLVNHRQMPPRGIGETQRTTEDNEEGVHGVCSKVNSTRVFHAVQQEPCVPRTAWPGQTWVYILHVAPSEGDLIQTTSPEL